MTTYCTLVWLKWALCQNKQWIHAYVDDNDKFSKYVGVISLRYKPADSLPKEFRTILTNKKPTYLQTDKGKEIYNKPFAELMKKYSIKHYSTFTDKRATIYERFNGTVKEKMWRKSTNQGTNKPVYILPK
jgi:hypothetical protein